MSFSYTQPYIIVGAFIVRDEKLLLIQENHDPDKGKWNLPSGKLDFGESPIDGVKREAFEEAGIDFEPVSIVGIHSIYRQDVPGEIHALRIAYVGIFEGEVNLEHGETKDGVAEIGDYKWVTLDEALQMDNSQLRYHDVKNLVQNYLDNKSYPLDIVGHIVQL